jgi:hypothetical protein
MATGRSIQAPPYFFAILATGCGSGPCMAAAFSDNNEA